MRHTRSSTTALSVLGLRARGWVPNTKISPPEYSASSPASLENQESLESPSRLENDFYRARLQAWDDRQEQRRVARTSLHEEELTWMSTVQDARFALLVSPETGFDTWGIETSVAEILPGWHTGRHLQARVWVQRVATRLRGAGRVRVGQTPRDCPRSPRARRSSQLQCGTFQRHLIPVAGP